MEKFDENPLATILPDGGYTAIFRTIAVIGDSLASGEHESLDENGVVGYHDYYEYSWGQFIARKCGCKVTNYSRGGLTAKDFHTLAHYMNCFAEENACQAYIIALGVNDMTRVTKGELEFGDLENVDWENELNNVDTFVQNYVRILQRIRKVQPKARIFMVTPPRNVVNLAKQDLYDQVTEFIHKLAEKFEFAYVIDLRKYDIVIDEEYDKTYKLGGHLSAIGYKRTADVITTYIDWIIRHNIDDFKQVGFIGKDVHHCKEKW